MEKNGNYIPVDKTLMVLYIFALLDNYDTSIENGIKPKIDPYRDTLYMKTNEQKYVEIPEDLRKSAISQWLQDRKNKPRNHNYLRGEEESIHTLNTKTREKCKTCRKDKKRRDYTLIDTTFQLILCLMIIFTILYTLGLIRKGVLHF
jgi:hypothetical protein